MSLYNFFLNGRTQRGIPVPAAASYVFVPGFTLPVISINGPGVPVQNHTGGATMRPMQPPQVNYNQTAPYAGYGGLTAGTIRGTALSFNPLGATAQQVGGIQ